MDKKFILDPSGKAISMVTDSHIVREQQTIRNSLPPFFAGGVGLGVNPDMGRVTPAISDLFTIERNLRYSMISNFWSMLSQAYAEIGLISTVVDVPVDDALRGGIEIKSKEMDEDDIKDLLTFMEEKEDLIVAGYAGKWARLFGGGGIIPIIEDQDPETPLDINAIKEGTEITFRDFDLWEIFWDRVNTDGFDPGAGYGEVESEVYHFYGHPVHSSRVLKIKGKKAPSWVRPKLRGWGMSVVERLIRSINQYLKSNDLLFEVLDEYKLDVYMLKDLINTLQKPDSEALVQARVQAANARKNYYTATVLDADDKFEQRQLSFSGLGDVALQIRIQAASDLRMPMTKLWGISAAGFNSGEDDIEVYNGMIESEIRPGNKRILLTMAKLRCQQMFGHVPDDLSIGFKSLRMLSAVDEQAVKTSKHARLLSSRQAGEISTIEFRDGCNKGDLMDISLDTEQDKLNPDDPMVEGIVTKAEDEPIKPEEPGGGAQAKPGTKTTTGGKKAPDAPKPKNGKQNKIHNRSKLPEIVTVGMISESRILAGRRSDNGKWTHPGGHMDPGETPEAGACREVLEETGIQLNESDLKFIAKIRITSPRTGNDFLLHCYLAKIQERPATNVEDPDQEIVEWKWVPLAPGTPELLAENRHAADDEVLEYLFDRQERGLMNSVRDFLKKSKHLFS